MNNLTIIYYINNFNENLFESLDSLINQTDKNFELLIIADGIETIKEKSIEKLDLNEKLSNFKFIVINNFNSHSASFELARKYVQTKYVYFADRSNIFDQNFVKCFNKFILNNKNEEYDLLFLTIGKDVANYPDLKKLKLCEFKKNIYLQILGKMVNKIINADFIKQNNISFIPFKHYTTHFSYELVSFAKKIAILPDVKISCKSAKFSIFNCYDLVYQCNQILNHKDDEFYKTNKTQIEYIMIRMVLYSFLKCIYIDDKFNKTKNLGRAIDYAKHWCDKKIPNWKKNKTLLAKDNLDDKTVINYLQHIIFMPFYIKHFMNKNK